MWEDDSVVWTEGEVKERQRETTKQVRAGEERSENRRKTRRHFGVEADLDTSLNLVLGFHEKIQQLLQ